MNPNCKECLPPQYITCLACGSVGTASAGAVSAIVVIGNVKGYIKENGIWASKNYKLEVPLSKVVELED